MKSWLKFQYWFVVVQENLPDVPDEFQRLTLALSGDFSFKVSLDTATKEAKRRFRAARGTRGEVVIALGFDSQRGVDMALARFKKIKPELFATGKTEYS